MFEKIKGLYKVNHKFYMLLLAIFILSLMISFDLPTHDCQDIIKNLSYGCIASTFIAWLIEIENAKGQNLKYMTIYYSIYSDFKFQVTLFLRIWAEICKVCFKESEYENEFHTWIEWYTIFKKEIESLDTNKQAELIEFTKRELTYPTKKGLDSLQQIMSQKYFLYSNDLLDDKINGILEDFEFEYKALDMCISKDNDDVIKYIDAISDDFIKYIERWKEISYYNNLKFKPYCFNEAKNEYLKKMILQLKSK